MFCDFQRYLLFEKKNSQGNQWIEGFVEVEPVTTEFQIVIEATGRNGIYVINDIAIDDVALLKDGDCMQFVKNETATVSATEESGGIYNIQSCANRCSETQSVRGNGTDTFIEGQTITEKCDCHPECLDLDTCCPDYKSKCFEGN